nr:hypothetical protein [uncultured Marvinbryantia sp.]
MQSYEKLFAQRQLAEFGEKQKKKLADKRRELDKAKVRISEIDGVIQKLYENNSMGKISDERFATMSISLENEQRELKTVFPLWKMPKSRPKAYSGLLIKRRRLPALKFPRLNWYTSLLKKSWYPHPNTRTASVIRRLQSITTVLALSESRQQQKWKNTSKNTSAKSLS